MIHDTKSYPYGALEYDEAGIEYEICTCYRKGSKYCFEHDHPTNPCNCSPKVFWEIRSFASERCKWEQCMDYDEYLHCEHLYCWKHERYWFNKYSKCEDCKKENGIRGDLYWNDLAHRIVIQKKNEKEAQNIKEMPEIKTSTETSEPQMKLDHENLNTPLEGSQQQISPPNQMVDELERQLKQIKLINEDYEKRCQELSENLKTERKRTEALAEEIVKYELIEPMIIQKEESWCHCENCKETETYYEYCIPSIILLYKTLYSMEKSIREEKEKELNENDNLLLQINEEQAKEISEEELQQQAITLKQKIDELK